MFNEELENLKADKMKNGYRIAANVMQLTNAMHHLSELAGDQSFLSPFLTHFSKVCQTLTAQLSAMTQSNVDLDDEKRKVQYDSRH